MALTIGCHLSFSDGYLAMGQVAESIGANTFAFFTRNPRGGSAKNIDKTDSEDLVSFMAEKKFGKLVVHAPYTLNACSDKENVRAFAKQVFKEDLLKMELIPNQYYNFHPGSHMKQGVDIGCEMIADVLNEVLMKTQTTTVLLETMAGKGSEVGSRFEEIRKIIDMVDLKDKIGVCLDTCHVYDAGYDIVNNLDGVLQEFDEVIGLNFLKAVHLNDSKNPFESHKDRHEKIGFGSIGLNTILNVLQHPSLKNLPFILETPNDLDGYKSEISLIREKLEA